MLFRLSYMHFCGIDVKIGALMVFMQIVIKIYFQIDYGKNILYAII